MNLSANPKSDCEVLLLLESIESNLSFRFTDMVFSIERLPV